MLILGREILIGGGLTWLVIALTGALIILRARPDAPIAAMVRTGRNARDEK